SYNDVIGTSYHTTFSTPTNNRLRTSSNTRNQAVIQDGRVDIQSKNVGYVGNGSKNAGRIAGNQATNAGNEQMLLAARYEAKVNLDTEENDFMLMNAYGDDQLEELNASVIMMAYIQPNDNKSDVEPTYDVEIISKVNASQIDQINGLLSKGDHVHRNHEKFKTIKHTSADDQIDSDIIFDDPYVENNSGQVEHNQDAHDQTYADIESLIYNVQVEAKK
ncbi:hypothetical protein Tco_1123290, partial [Tanacetum coccineum]